jgi:hypothetical protein
MPDGTRGHPHIAQHPLPRNAAHTLHLQFWLHKAIRNLCLWDYLEEADASVISKLIV